MPRQLGGAQASFEISPRHSPTLNPIGNKIWALLDIIIYHNVVQASNPRTTGDLRVYRLCWKSPPGRNEFKRNGRFVLRPDTQAHDDEYELPEAIPSEFDILTIEPGDGCLTFIAADGELPDDAETLPWRIDLASQERRREQMISALWSFTSEPCLSFVLFCSRT